MFKSLRWSLQSWHAGLLAVVLAGFGAVSYYGISRAQYEQLDEQLGQLAGTVAMSLRPTDNGFGGPFGQGGGPGNFGQDHGGRMGGPGRPSGGGDGHGEIPMERGHGGPGGGRRGPEGQMPPGLQLSEAAEQRFNGDEGRYFVIWGRDSAVLDQSANAPEIADPAPRVFTAPGNFGGQGPGTGPGGPGFGGGPGGGPGFGGGPGGPPQNVPLQFRWRGGYREAFQSGPFGTRVLVGAPSAPVTAALRHDAVLLAAAGAGVLMLGLAGGWMLSLGVVRPIKAMTAAAQDISASNLSRRIDVAGTQSELGTLAAVLNETFARLETAFAQQVRFTADASHELRTPLTVIHTHAQLALSRERSAEEYKKMFETSLRATERMKHLVDSLLLLARADAGKLALNKNITDLGQTVQECVEMVETLAAKKGVKIETQIQAAEMKGDTTRLGQLVTNILTNAIRYNKEHGRVAVTLITSEKEIVLTVDDTGVGIPTESLPHLFERFYRVDEARNREEGGSGLGLAICKSIVEGHGGWIGCESEVGKGTRFTVHLPREN